MARRWQIRWDIEIEIRGSEQMKYIQKIKDFLWPISTFENPVDTKLPCWSEWSVVYKIKQNNKWKEITKWLLECKVTIQFRWCLRHYGDYKTRAELEKRMKKLYKFLKKTKDPIYLINFFFLFTDSYGDNSFIGYEYWKKSGKDEFIAIPVMTREK